MQTMIAEREDRHSAFSECVVQCSTVGCRRCVIEVDMAADTLLDHFVSRHRAAPSAMFPAEMDVADPCAGSRVKHGHQREEWIE